MSEVVQELRATMQTLMDKVVLVEALLAERPPPPASNGKKQKHVLVSTRFEVYALA